MHRAWRDLAAWLLFSFSLHSAIPSRASEQPRQVHERDRGYDAPGSHQLENGADDGSGQFQKFVTRPDILCKYGGEEASKTHALMLPIGLRWNTIVYNDEALSPGYWFVAPYHVVRQTRNGEKWVGPHIYDQKGELIWSGVPLFNGWDVFGLTVRQDANGDDMLSMVFRHEYGLLMDSSYMELKRSYIGGDGFDLNMHEFHVVDNATRLLHMTSKELKTTPAISADIGFKGRCEVHFQGFEERDIETLEPTFKWYAEGIIPLSDTVLTVRPPEIECRHTFDYTHCNSLDKFSDGDYLIGCRHTDTVYKISHKDGSIVWRFGGNRWVKTDFKFDDHFSGQHDVKIWDSNDTHVLIGMLDNAYRIGSHEISNDYSRGLLISLDTQEMTAEVVSRYPHPEGELVIGRGSFQLLPNSNAFVGFTEHSSIAEFTHNGTLLMESKVTPKIKSYRAYKFPWVGHPALPPDVYSAVFLEGKSYRTNIWISWNGATEVVTWKIYKADTDGSRELIASTPKFGFETTVTHTEYVSHIIVVALDRNGAQLGESKVTKTVGPAGLVAGLDAKEVDWIQNHPPYIVTFFQQPAVAFICGLIICAGMAFTGWAAWFFTRSLPARVACWEGETLSSKQNHLLKEDEGAL